MQADEYMKEVAIRYNQLDERGKEIIRGFVNSENGDILNYLLGPRFAPLISLMAKPALEQPQEPTPEMEATPDFLQP
jgi:hypothetical protein